MTKPVAEIVAELKRLRIAAGEGKLRMSGGGLNADRVAEWVCYLVENSDTILAELTHLQETNGNLETIIHKFDACIRRIVGALGIGEACAGVDTDERGGHTAEVIVERIAHLTEENSTLKNTRNREIEAEREACAQEADHWQGISGSGHACGAYIAAAIRGRGKP